MKIRDFIKERVPFSLKIYRKVVSTVIKYRKNKILEELKRGDYNKATEIMETLIDLQSGLKKSDNDWQIKIEAEREHLLQRKEILDDKSLGEAGLYDKNISIKKACKASKPPKQALLLFLLTRALNPLNVIELGTNVGISSAYIAAGLKDNSKNGMIVTLDASPYRQKLAKEIHKNLDLDNITYVNGLFKNTLRPVLMNLETIDLAFIDGHHQYQPTLDYFEEIMKFSTPDTVFVFDDIRWSDGMKKAWDQIKSDKRLCLLIDLFSLGIVTRCKNGYLKRYVSRPILLF